jgi:hypothetical protein
MQVSNRISTVPSAQFQRVGQSRNRDRNVQGQPQGHQVSPQKLRHLARYHKSRDEYCGDYACEESNARTT